MIISVVSIATIHRQLFLDTISDYTAIRVIHYRPQSNEENTLVTH